MKRFLLGILTAIVVPTAVLVGVLLWDSNLRHAAFRGVVELPGQAYFFIIRRHLLGYDFRGVNYWLEKNLDLVENFAPGRNTLLPGMMKNAEFAVARARTDAQFQQMLPFLKRFVKNQPDLYPARLWIARALSRQAPKTALVHLESAVKLIPADSRAYRIAIGMAVRSNLPDMAATWCQRYRTAQFGGNAPYWYNPSFVGIGLRRMELKITGADGKTHGALNSGLQLGETRPYEFTFERTVDIKAMRLELGLVPGVKTTLSAVRVVHQGRVHNLSPVDFALTSWSGFHLDDGSVLATAGDGETVYIHPVGGTFGRGDKVIMDVRFERLAVAAPGICGNSGAKP